MPMREPVPVTTLCRLCGGVPSPNLPRPSLPHAQIRLLLCLDETGASHHVEGVVMGTTMYSNMLGLEPSQSGVSCMGFHTPYHASTYFGSCEHQ